MTGRRESTAGAVSAPSAATPPVIPPPAVRPTLVAATGALLGFGLSALMAFLSDGVHHDDDLTHLLFARWSFTHPEFLLNEWGRPGFTLLFAAPAQLGWLAARLFAGGLTALTAWLTYLIARRQGLPLAAFAPWLVWLQPMTFTLSYTTLTETVLAFYLALAMWLFLRRAFALSAIALSLGLLTRHETAVWLPLWGLALWRVRAPWYAIAALVWAPIAHNVLSAIFLGKWPFLMFLTPVPTEEYGHGGWFSMLSRWVLAAGAGVLVLALAGGWHAARRPWGWLWIGAGLSYFLAHTLIFRFGLFASGGYHRFLVPIAPVVAVAAAETLGRFFDALRRAWREADPSGAVRDARRAIAAIAVVVAVLWSACELEVPYWLVWARHWLRVGGVLLLAVIVAAWVLTGSRPRWVRVSAISACPAVCLWFAGHQCQIAAGVQPPHQQCAPLVLVEDQQLIREATDWIRAHGLARRNIIHGNPWVDEFLNIVASPHRRTFGEQLATLRPGDIVFWDRRYVGRPGEHSVESIRAIPGLLERWHGRPHTTDGVYCRVFEMQGGGHGPTTTGPARNPLENHAPAP